MEDLNQTSDVIGRYELLTRLATGGMAELFLARERGLAGLERLVVVKRILPHLADQPSFVEMFLREARIVARLSHPNVVQIYELGQQQDSYHIAMEYIHGSTVRELLVLAQNDQRQMPYGVAVGIAEQACRGLHAAHELCDLDGKPLGLVHRDISPHNLMCTTDGHVKLLDFGVAKSTSASVEATYSGNLKGKFAYLSPEQCRHEALDRRSDLFAMGIVLWEMLTMRRLFKRKTELKMMQAIIGGDVPAVSKFRPEVPELLEQVVSRALSVDRDDRFETAEQMRRSLVDAAENAGLDWGEDRLAQFLVDTAGDRLEKRQATVEHACERELTVAERRRLLHMTGSDSRSAQKADPGEDGPDEPTHRADAQHIQKLVEQDRRRKFGDDAAGHTPAERPSALSGNQKGRQRADSSGGFSRFDGRSLSVIAAAGLATLLVGGLVLFAIHPGEESSQSGLSERVADSADVDEQTQRDQYEEFVAMIDVDDEQLTGEPIVLGWPPIVDAEVMRREVEPLHRYLERELGRPVPVRVPESYGELSRQLRSGEVDAALMTPTLYVLTTEIDDEIEFLIMREFDGTMSTDGYLVGRRADDYRQLEQLEGETFCFVHRASTSGYLLPRHHIRSQGHDPDEFVGDVHWSGDHFQVMRDLIDGKCEAAAVYSGAHMSAEEYGIPSSQLSMIATTGRLPQDVIAVPADTDDELRHQLTEAFDRFDPEELFGVERLGENQRITGFVEESEDVFDELRGLVRIENIDVEHL